MDSASCRDEDIKLTSFDLLNRPDVQIHEFREPLLCHVLPRPLTPDVRPKTGEFCVMLAARLHAPLGRMIGIA